MGFFDLFGIRHGFWVMSVQKIIRRLDLFDMFDFAEEDLLI